MNFKDTGGTLRMRYFDRMSMAENDYDASRARIMDLLVNQGRMVYGTAQWTHLEQKIQEERKASNDHLARFHAYAAALTAVSTVMVTK